MQGHSAIVELLIERGSDVNTIDGSEHTPLWWAINNRHGNTADVLRQHGT